MSSTTAYSPKSAWEIYSSETDRKAMRDFAKKYSGFLSHCKTERETVEYVRNTLQNAGFSEDFSQSRIMRPLREKAIFAAIRGKRPLQNGFNLVAAHADSPRLDFKQHPFIEQAGVAQAKTHYYGGIRKYQWLARPLALRGVIVMENGRKIAVNIGDDPADPVFTISDLLPHLAQKQQEQKISDAFEAEKLNVILGHEPPAAEKDKKAEEGAVKKQILAILNLKYGVNEEDFISAELEAVPAGPARFVGLDESMLGAYGQDDRICVFCALEALLSGPDEPENSMAVIFWDKEEIGSDGATGASSRFLQYCLEDAAASWAPDARPSAVLLATRALSGDVTAALDPDYQDVHEKQNAALLGYGPCFSKFTGSRGKYGANDADAEFFASLRQLFNAAGIPWQAAELGKVDLGGGGTVALFMAALGMRVIDLGPALLSMHSPFEISSVADLYAAFQAYKAFLAS